MSLAAMILATEAAEESESSGIDLLIPDINETIAGLIAFGIIFLVVLKWGVPMLNKALEARQEAIKGELEAAEASKAQAEQLRTEYEQQLAGARDEAGEILESARQSGEDAKAGILSRAEEEAEAVKQRAQVEAAGERDRTAAALRREVADLSLDVAEKVVGESLDEERQRALVNRYIDELGT
jgi:F-type H+-transporting ATPase subunit b